MIIPLGKELDEILDILELKKNDITSAQAMELMTVCFKCFGQGLRHGRRPVRPHRPAHGDQPDAHRQRDQETGAMRTCI
jgi:hypothetical protein